MKKLLLSFAILLISTIAHVFGQSISDVEITPGYTNATITGRINNEVGAVINEYGVCWSTSSSPTINDNCKTIKYEEPGPFTIELSGLEPNTSYYCRTFITLDEGHHMNETIMFQTTESPLYSITILNTDNGIITASVNSSEEGDIISVTTVPHDFYDLSLAQLHVYKTDDETTTVHVSQTEENHIFAFVMPNFDVTVSGEFVAQSPVIHDSIENPSPICAGSTLNMTSPSVSYAETETWQLSENDSFDNPLNYSPDDTIDITYDGWFLRYYASNPFGADSSNVVSLTVKELHPKLFGDAYVCSNEEGTYRVEGADHAVFQWTVSDDETFSISDTTNPFRVLWTTNSGVKNVSVIVSDTESGCTVTLDMEVTVMSHIDSAQPIGKKTKDNVIYLLFYPNPDTIPYKYQWYRNDTVIGCNQQYYYKPLSEGGVEPGKYKVYISYNEGEAGSLICGAFSPELVVEPSSSNQLSIYPNPSHPNGKITVLNEDMEEALLLIYSIDGKLMHQQTITDYQSEVGINLPKGFYIAHLKSRQGTKTGRIVIE